VAQAEPEKIVTAAGIPTVGIATSIACWLTAIHFHPSQLIL
jgi:hypothetical protein